MLFQTKEVFSVESLINKALKQDIGPDPSIGVNQKKIKNLNLYYYFGVIVFLKKAAFNYLIYIYIILIINYLNVIIFYNNDA